MKDSIKISLCSLEDYNNLYKKIRMLKTAPQNVSINCGGIVNKELEKAIIFLKKKGVINIILIFESSLANYMHNLDKRLIIPFINEIVINVNRIDDINRLTRNKLSSKISLQLQLRKEGSYNKRLVRKAVNKGITNIRIKLDSIKEGEEKLRKILIELISFCRKHNVEIKNLDDIRLYSIKNNYVLVGPKELQIETVNYCNFNCLFCWFHSPFLEKKYLPKYIDFTLFKKIVAQAADMGTEIITLSGNGEPFMHPRINDMIEYITKKRLNLKIYTNAALINRQRAELISKIEDSFIHVNLPATTEATFKKMRTKALPNSLNSVKDALMMLNKQANKNKIRTEIGFIITRYNFHEISLIFKLAKETGTNSICFKFVKAEPKIEKILLSKEETADVVKMLKENINKEEYRGINTNVRGILEISKNPIFSRHHHNMYYYSSNLKHRTCYNGWFYTKICLSGHTSPCGINDMSLSRGNIRKNDFSSIYFSPQLKEVLINGKNGLKFDKESLFKCNFCFRAELNETIYNSLQNEKEEAIF